MRNGRKALLVAVIAFVTAATGFAEGVDAVAPEAVSGPTDLGTLGGDACAYDVNDTGTVIGTSDRTNGRDFGGFVWTTDQGMVDPLPDETDWTQIDSLNNQGDLLINRNLRRANGDLTPISTIISPNASAASVNDSLEIAGSFVDAQFRNHAMFWSEATGRVDLGTLGSADARAHRINRHGAIYGTRTTSGGWTRAFTWAPGGVVTNLGALGGTSSDVNPVGINDSGWIAGTATVAEGANRPFVWRPGIGMTNLGTLGGFEAEAIAINNRGQVLGRSQTGAFLQPDRYFIWHPSTGLVDIGLGVGPSPSFSATDFNDHAQIVGTISSPAAVEAATWDAVNGLQTLAGSAGRARAINNHGQVVGCTFIAEAGESHAALWTVETPVQVHWSAAEYARIQQLVTFYDMDYDELTRFGVYVAAFINGIDPSPTPTPITVDPPGTAHTQTITWHPDEIALLEAVKHRWVLDDEDAHRWGYLLLSFIATLQGA